MQCGQARPRSHRRGTRNILDAQLEWNRNDYVLTLYFLNLTDERSVAALNFEFSLRWFATPVRRKPGIFIPESL